LKKVIRVGNAQAFWGDRNDAAAELLGREPTLDYLTMDYLAEVSMSILAAQRGKDPSLGYARDFIEVVESLAGYWAAGGTCRLITNAGGLNPTDCGRAVATQLSEFDFGNSVAPKICVVVGDDCLDQIRDHADVSFDHLETGQSIATIRDRLITANAYTGAATLADALQTDATIIVTGRIADPSMVVATAMHEFKLANDDYQPLAGATLAGHLIECGTHVSGGISTDWLDLSNNANIGFPIVEIFPDGSCVATKPDRTGGLVDSVTVREQLLYEIGDPANYLSPDVCVSMERLQVDELTADRVRISGAVGSPPPETMKVTATYLDGFRVSGQLTIIGRDAVAKAERLAAIVKQQMDDRGLISRQWCVEILGAGDSNRRTHYDVVNDRLFEVVLRISAESDDRHSLEQLSRLFIPMVTAGPQGTTGYAEGRPRVRPIVRYWPCLIAASDIQLAVQPIAAAATVDTALRQPDWPPAFLKNQTNTTDSQDQDQNQETPQSPPVTRDPTARLRWKNPDSSYSLGFLCHARSGDKGTGANIGIIARDARYFAWLRDWLTTDRLREHLDPIGFSSCERFELENLSAFNFVVLGILSPVVRNDAQGKSLGQIVLEIRLPDDCPHIPK
jgi:hypothetical protein